MGIIETDFGTTRLSAAELAAVAVYGAKATWPAGFTVYQRGADADGIFVVLRGRIVLRSRVKAGRGFVPAIATAGETFGSEGLTGSAHYVTDAKADEPSETLHLSGIRFRAFVREQPQQALALVAQVMAEHTSLLERLRELATLSVEQRLVTTLLRMAHNHTFVSGDGRIALGAPQYRLLCELVGATRESVSLVLNRLIGDGLAERQGTTYLIAPARELASRVATTWRDTEIVMPAGYELEGGGATV
jgi:CRP/FNR family transcriptional regulator, cyclic AMP receptor protein